MSWQRQFDFNCRLGRALKVRARCATASSKLSSATDLNKVATGCVPTGEQKSGVAEVAISTFGRLQSSFS